ncbi:MAG: hypothetical protein IPO90_00565 [Flavobacteriales bacterium]|nr:hypothetical protein [Flavobacteriales bacterium]
MDDDVAISCSFYMNQIIPEAIPFHFLSTIPEINMRKFGHREPEFRQVPHRKFGQQAMLHFLTSGAQLKLVNWPHAELSEDRDKHKTTATHCQP